MLGIRQHRSVKKNRSRTVQRKSKQATHRSLRKKSRPLSFTDRFEKSLKDIQSSGSLTLTYTVDELETICQQLAIQQMSSTATTPVSTDLCSLICLFCQNLIYEPLTLLCGHTYCEQCIKDEQISSTMNCPRCPEDLRGQTQSSVVHARELSFSRNHFLKQIFERFQLLNDKQQLNFLYHKGKSESSAGNYQKAIEVYSQILEKNPDHHLALYGRAKSHMAVSQFEQALVDADRVVLLKPYWPKGYLCRSEILFELNHFKSALMSSLKALVINPEDPIAKSVMARHLHAVLHNDDSEQSASSMECETEMLHSIDDESPSNSIINQTQSTLCKLNESNTENSSATCLCTQIDHSNLSPRDFECSICVNLLWFPITTPCGHVFCRECLIRSVDNTQIQCPMCKSSLETFFPLLIELHVSQTDLISKMIRTFFAAEYEERRQLSEQETIQANAISSSALSDTTNAPLIFEVPVFVCVLALPCCSYPLHVFEPRYRLMMRRTLETESRTFGMCTYDDQTDDFSDYGTLLYIRNLMYTPDGRSIIETVGQRRFRVLERGVRDGYSTAKIELIRDNPIEQHEFDDLVQLNRTTYNRVRAWYHRLDAYRRTVISRQLEEYPECDDLAEGSTDGPSWAWIMLYILPISPLLRYTALASHSFRVRLQIINDVLNFSNHQQQTVDSIHAQ